MNRTKLPLVPLIPSAVLLALWAFVGIASAGTAKYQVLYRFQGGTDAAYPFAGLVADENGNLYGTTYRGGRAFGLCQADDGCGTAFQLRPPVKRGGMWTESVIYKFGPFAHPASSLIIDQAGNLYGTTPYAGASDNGTVFELQKPVAPSQIWTKRILYSFSGGNDGATPVSNLIFDNAGNIYGTTRFGGGGPCLVFQQGSGCGTAFQLTAPKKAGGVWKESVLYSFIPANDYPLAGLVSDSNGNLYGTTAGDQSASFGTVFELAPPAGRSNSWTQTTLYSFGSVKNDGSTPSGNLILDNAGNLYGTTSVGGGKHTAQCLGQQDVGYGTVFELERRARPDVIWSEKILHAFNGSDGSCPTAALVFDQAGKLYGTTAQGGSNSGVCGEIGGCGTVFRLEQSAGGAWTEVILHEFSADSDGLEPVSALIFRKERLYGTTAGGGGACVFPIPCGTVFSRIP